MFGNFKNSFRILIASSFILSTSFFVQNSSALAGDFSKSCRNIELLNDGHSLRAICRDSHGSESPTAIDLNVYIANINGALTWQHNGNYVASCKFMSGSAAPDYGKYYLIGTCLDEKEQSQLAIIDLNTKLSNINGQFRIDSF